MNKKSVGCILFVLMIGIVGVNIFFNTSIASASEEKRTKQITSVQIQSGDTLWKIASDYYTEDYSDLETYIREIKDSNQLYSDTIHEGQYLIIPYYTSVFSVTSVASGI